MVAVERLRANRTGIASKEFKKYQLIEAAKDPLTYYSFFYAISCVVPNSGVSFVSLPFSLVTLYDLSQSIKLISNCSSATLLLKIWDLATLSALFCSYPAVLLSAYHSLLLASSLGAGLICVASCSLRLHYQHFLGLHSSTIFHKRISEAG